MAVGAFEPMRFDIEGGAQVVLASRHERAEPAQLAQIVRAAWAEVAGLTIIPGGPVQAVTRIVRARVAAFIDFSAESAPRGTAGCIERAFKIEVESNCGRCRSARVLRPGTWKELRDSLAPANLPEWLAPRGRCDAPPSDEDLGRAIGHAIECGFEIAWARAELERHLARLERVLCPACVTSERARLQEFVQTFGPRFEEFARRKSSVRQRRQWRESEPLLYAIVTAPARELGARVSEWIRCGYEIWGPPLVCGEQFSQAVVRAGVTAGGRSPGDPSQCSGSLSLLSAQAEAVGATGALGSPEDELLERPVVELELSTRSHNCLRAYGIRTLKDLVQCTEAQLLSMQNLGRKSLADITCALGRLGLRAGVHHADFPLPREDANGQQSLPDASRGERAEAGVSRPFDGERG